MLQAKAQKTPELKQQLRPDPVPVAAGTLRILARQAQTELLERDMAALEASLQDAADMGVPVRLHDIALRSRHGRP